ncbi:MAG TPA: sigma-54 dependent transcriptional regulator [Gemmatimonadales bacterium]|nr:sigma-54 dependent transcriptional regulator [Gemmatimonadales bacterium]
MADSVLLIDDDPDVLRAVGDYFDKIGYEVGRAATGEEGVTAFQRLRPDVVILDLHLPDVGGLEVLERLRSDGGSVILLTGQGDIDTAVRAMQLGADHFLTKPVDMNHLVAAAARVSEKIRLVRQNTLLRARGHEHEGLESLGVSPTMRELGRQIELLAASERSTVLLTGESGTGKGWVARVIHHLSPRQGGPFVEVNCGGLSATFLESELFGHERGAFTDAKERRQGLFELADRGTIFLDEIGDLASELQPKLLKVLETKTFRRLGGTREITVDARLVAATNRDLVADVQAGRFREDLYYRLSVMPLHIPSVHERSRDDRLTLLTRILAEFAPQMPGCPSACSAEALDRLLTAPWPGNVREMRNVIERAMILARGAPQLGVEHLPPDLRRGGGSDRRHQPQALADVERVHIERTLKFHGGNRTRAALELGISRATLINKIKVYGLDRNERGT